MKKVIVFGATGTVGAYTALELKANGYDVIAVGRRGSDNGFFGDNGIAYYSVDISDEHSFNHLPTTQIDCVIHFAGAMPAHMSGYEPHEYIDSIITGTLNVLEYARRVLADRMVFSHSIADILYLFGNIDLIPADAERKFPLTGDHAIYSISKNAAVNLIEHYHHTYGLKRFILRLPTIYAYHPNPYYCVDGKKKWMGFRMIMDKAIKGETIEIWGDPESRKEIVYVKDFTQIVQKSIEATCDGGMYNVGRGLGVSLEDQIRGIIEILSPKERKSEVVYRREMPSSPQFVLDISKTKFELGYIPRYDYLAYLEDYKREMDLQRFAKLWGYSSEYL